MSEVLWILLDLFGLLSFSLDFIVFSYIPIFPYPLWLSLLGHLVVSIVLSLRILLYYHDIPMILYVLHVLLIRCLLYTEVSLAVIKPLMILSFSVALYGKVMVFCKIRYFLGESYYFLSLITNVGASSNVLCLRSLVSLSLSLTTFIQGHPLTAFGALSSSNGVTSLISMIE